MRLRVAAGIVVHEAMRSKFGWVFVGLVACTNMSTSSSSGAPTPEPTPPAVTTPPAAEPTPPAVTTPPVVEPTAPAKAAAVTVQMTAATLGDDCGGPPGKAKAKERSAMAKSSRMKGDRACEQSSMQLSVVAAADGAPTRLAVKMVELFDDKGKRIGELTARTPSAWDASGAYQAWDEHSKPGQELSVSYALSQPPWGDVSDRRSRGYVLKAVLTVGDGEQAVQRDVRVEAPTILPPNVKT